VTLFYGKSLCLIFQHDVHLYILNLNEVTVINGIVLGLNFLYVFTNQCKNLVTRKKYGQKNEIQYGGRYHLEGTSGGVFYVEYLGLTFYSSMSNLALILSFSS